MSQVRHPNMAGTIEKGAVGQAFYFVTEYCDLGNLCAVDGIQRRQAGACGTAARDAALPRRPENTAHLRRLLHGHISPQNILFASAVNPRTVKISDFALAAKFERGFSSPPSKSVDLRRACFVPPERFTSDYGLDTRSDLWGLAAVFYHAISGGISLGFSRPRSAGRDSAGGSCTPQREGSRGRRLRGRGDRPGTASKTSYALFKCRRDEIGLGRGLHRGLLNALPVCSLLAWGLAGFARLRYHRRIALLHVEVCHLTLAAFSR